MNSKFLVFWTLILMLTCGSLQGCATAKSGAQFAQAGKTYMVSKTLTGTIRTGRGVTLLFKNGGRCVNATIVGDDTKIVAETNGVIFSNCTFQGTFVNSSLKATQFGCSDNLTKKPLSWSYGEKGLKTSASTYAYVSSNSVYNKKPLNMIAQFCSRSNGVSIEFDGSFYTPVVDLDGPRGNNVMAIRGAKNLCLKGGTLIQGLQLINCTNVLVESMKFIGQHQPHQFPPIYDKKENLAKVSDKRYTAKTCYNIVENQFSPCGLAPEGIYIKVENGGESSNIVIDQCSFEMRANGVITGIKGRTNNIHHVTVKNCNFSHIYFQPVGFHGSYNVVENVQAEYSMQGFDFSSGCNNSVIRNSSFRACAVGPKQETRVTKEKTHYDNYANAVENCYYQINEDFRTIDIKRQIFYASEGKDGDFFKMTDVTFDVDVSSPIDGIECRAYGLELNNLKLNINQTGGRPMKCLFTPNGSSSYTPKIIINHADIVCNTNLETLAMKSSAGLEMQIADMTISGAEINDVAFRGLKSLSITGSQFMMPCNYFTQLTPEVSVEGTTISKVKRIAFYPANKGQEQYKFTLKRSVVNAGTSLFWVANSNSCDINASDNIINTAAVVTYSENFGRSDVKITNNTINVTGKSAFSGMRNLSNSRNQQLKVESNVMSLSRGALVYDSQSSKFSNTKVKSANIIR